jgi:hypothetical protein
LRPAYPPERFFQHTQPTPGRESFVGKAPRQTLESMHFFSHIFNRALRTFTQTRLIELPTASKMKCKIRVETASEAPPTPTPR